MAYEVEADVEKFLAFSLGYERPARPAVDVRVADVALEREYVGELTSNVGLAAADDVVEPARRVVVGVDGGTTEVPVGRVRRGCRER